MKMKTNSRSFIFSAVAVGLAELLLIAWLIHMKFEPAWLAIMIAVSLAGCVLHIKAAAADPGYLRKLTGITDENKNRIAQFDHLRVIAVCGVILTHTVQVDTESYHVPALYFANILWVLTMAANGIYVMLSGALMYRWKEEKLRSFYARRFIVVAVPLTIYYLWYTAVNYHLGRGWNWVSIRSVPHWLLANEMREAPHFWLIYVILSIYVTVPLFRLLFKNVKYTDLTKVLAAVFLFTAFSNALLPYAQLAVTLPLTGWLFMSLLGYWVCLPQTRKYDRVLMIAGAGAAAAVSILTVINPDTEFLDLYCLNDRPLVMLLCMGIFAAVMHFGRPFSRSSVPVRCISRYGYGIILIHWWTLHFVVRSRLSISSMSFHYLGIPITLVLTIVISWIFCFIADNLLVMPVQKLLGKILRT